MSTNSLGIAPPTLLTMMSSWPNVVDRGLRERGDLVEVGQVGGHDDRLSPHGLDLCGDLVQLVLRTGGQDDVGAGLCEGEGAGGPDPTTCAGDDGDSVVESESLKHHGGDSSAKLEHVLVLRVHRVASPTIAIDD